VNLPPPPPRPTPLQPNMPEIAAALLVVSVCDFSAILTAAPAALLPPASSSLLLRDLMMSFTRETANVAAGAAGWCLRDYPKIAAHSLASQRVMDKEQKRRERGLGSKSKKAEREDEEDETVETRVRINQHAK
jgi:hypothetical protein